MMKIYQVYSDVDCIYITRSESLAYRKGLEHGKGPIWLTESNLDQYPANEVVYDSLSEFRKEYNL